MQIRDADRAIPPPLHPVLAHPSGQVVAALEHAPAQAPPELGQFAVAAEELNEESGKVMGGGSEAFAGEERPERRGLAGALVEFRREPLAACFNAQRVEDFRAPAWDQLYCSLTGRCRMRRESGGTPRCRAIREKDAPEDEGSAGAGTRGK
jgi:hypothetical protein